MDRRDIDWRERFPGVAFERQVDQPAEQFGVLDAGRAPQFGIHADGGKARDRVDLEAIRLVRRAQPEVRARDTAAAISAKLPYRKGSAE